MFTAIFQGAAAAALAAGASDIESTKPRLRRRDRTGDAWEREPWNANVLDRSTQFERAANEPPPEVA